MHSALYPVAAFAFLLFLGVCTVMVVRARSRTTRILAMDTITLVLAGFLMLLALAQRAPVYLDAALMLVLLGFVGTLAAVRFHGGGRPM